MSNAEGTENPTSTSFENTHAPTVKIYEADFVLVNHKFLEHFSITDFNET